MKVAPRAYQRNQVTENQTRFIFLCALCVYVYALRYSFCGPHRIVFCVGPRFSFVLLCPNIFIYTFVVCVVLPIFHPCVVFLHHLIYVRQETGKTAERPPIAVECYQATAKHPLSSLKQPTVATSMVPSAWPARGLLTTTRHPIADNGWCFNRFPTHCKEPKGAFTSFVVVHFFFGIVRKYMPCQVVPWRVWRVFHGPKFVFLGSCLPTLCVSFRNALTCSLEKGRIVLFFSPRVHQCAWWFC